MEIPRHTIMRLLSRIFAGQSIGDAFTTFSTSPVLIPASRLDYEAKNNFTLAYTVTLTVIGAPAPVVTTFFITVILIDMNKPPQVLPLTPSPTVLEYAPLGTFVASFAHYDENVGDTNCTRRVVTSLVLLLHLL